MSFNENSPLAEIKEAIIAHGVESGLTRENASKLVNDFMIAKGVGDEAMVKKGLLSFLEQ